MQRLIQTLMLVTMVTGFIQTDAWGQARTKREYTLEFLESQREDADTRSRGTDVDGKDGTFSAAAREKSRGFEIISLLSSLVSDVLREEDRASTTSELEKLIQRVLNRYAGKVDDLIEDELDDVFDAAEDEEKDTPTVAGNPNTVNEALNREADLIEALLDLAEEEKRIRRELEKARTNTSRLQLKQKQNNEAVLADQKEAAAILAEQLKKADAVLNAP